MVGHTRYFYLLLLNIFTVFSQVESMPNLTASYKDLKDVPGFSLTEEEIRRFHIWPNGFIPYYIDVTSFSDKVLRDKIRSFLNMVNSITTLKFEELPSPPEDDHTRWVFFINRKGLLGCADHSVWDLTSEGVQRVVLGYDCMNKEGELPEAVLAIAGVPAQHTAPDRDEYVEVFTENVIPDKVKLFDKLSNSDWLFHDLPYDYDSVGHYHNFKYSMNGKTVIQPRNPDIAIGEAKELSEIDIQKIRLLYNFITQKKQLDVPECQKLFKTGSKFKNFVPSKIIPKPVQKPNKYTGRDPKNGDIEYANDEQASSEKQTDNNSGNQVLADDQDELNTEEMKGTPGKPDITNLPHSSESDDGHQQKLSMVKKKTHKFVKPILLGPLSDKQTKLKLNLKVKTSDPLEYLSDYSSETEEKKADKIIKEKRDTLKYKGKKLK